MKKIGIFFGSTTGNTEMVAQKIQEKLGSDVVDVKDIDGTLVEDVNGYEQLAFGIPTWDIGELQEDWDNWMENFDRPDLDLKGKKFAVFGVGDQEGYPDTFGDAIGILYDKIVALGGVPVIDSWETDSYEFEDSVGLRNDRLVGMMIDEDSQSELTEQRIERWVEQARESFD